MEPKGLPPPVAVERRTSSGVSADRGKPPPKEEKQRKQRVLTRGTPSITRTIADAVVVKDRGLFLLTEPDGRVPIGQDHGFGLYYHDCRYLGVCELRLAGAYPVALGSTAEEGCAAIFQLTNPDLQVGGKTVVEKEELSLRWEHRIDGTALGLVDRISIRNWRRAAVELPVELLFDANFEDLFQVRGLLQERLGSPHPPEFSGDSLIFRYDGADGLVRTVTIALPPGLQPSGDRSVSGVVRLDGREEVELNLRFQLGESATGVSPARPPLANRRRLGLVLESDNLLLNRVVERSVGDLNLLRTTFRSRQFFAAGIPWFATLFGRDSLLSALQVLPFEPAMAAETLRLLAGYQGASEDPWRDEQPGKILHELRVGEMAQSGTIPHSPYFGTVDATPLFLILLGQHANWTGDLSLFHELRPNLERAVEWMQRYGDGDGDGYIEYQSTSEHGLINQGWKDSGDAIVDADGQVAGPPVALVEVQGYAYEARRWVAELYRRAGEPGRAESLEAEANQLRERFNRDFWIPELGCYALGLEGGKVPLAVVSSNAGHALWSGIADRDKATQTVERLMADDMFSGWGVRTLSSSEQGYIPIGYHLGTVWPHDNAIIAAGCRRYGFDAPASRIFEGITTAASHFDLGRLPELFTGYSRAGFGVPIRYPVACHPQAWAAGAVLYLLQSVLGISADGFARQLRIERPRLPDHADYLILRGIAVAGATAALRFGRNPDGTVTVETLELDGELEVVVT
jgi:glycogen debranching enzyme